MFPRRLLMVALWSRCFEGTWPVSVEKVEGFCIVGFVFLKLSLWTFFGPLFPAVLRFLPCFFLLPSVFSRNGKRGRSGSPTQSFVGLGGGSCILCAGDISSVPGRQTAGGTENEKLFQCSRLLSAFSLWGMMHWETSGFFVAFRKMGAFRPSPLSLSVSCSVNSLIFLLHLISSGNSIISGNEKIMCVIARRHF